MKPHDFIPMTTRPEVCLVCFNYKGNILHTMKPAGKDREQVGGDHYRSPKGIPEHWDIAWALGWDFFQYQITKYLWRWRLKGGIDDLKKAAHFLKKYIEVAERQQGVPGGMPSMPASAEEPQPYGYVDQDSPTGPARPTSADSPPVASGSEGLPDELYFYNLNGLAVHYRRVR